MQWEPQLCETWTNQAYQLFTLTRNTMNKPFEARKLAQKQPYCGGRTELYQLFSRILKSWQCFRLNSYRKLARKYPYMWRKFQLGSSVFLFSLSQLLSTDRIVISRKRVKTLHCATRRSEEQRHWGRTECKNSIVLSPQIVVYVSIEYF